MLISRLIRNQKECAASIVKVPLLLQLDDFQFRPTLRHWFCFLALDPLIVLDFVVDPLLPIL